MSDAFDYKTVVMEQGAEFLGIQRTARRNLILFADPEIGSTLAVVEEDFLPETVQRRLIASKREFSGAQAISGESVAK